MSTHAGQRDIAAIDACVVPVSAKTTWIFLRVTCRDGAVGFGEATRAGAEAPVLAEIAQARTAIVAKGLALPAGALSALATAHASDARYAVVNALEQALLDCQSRRAGLTLAQLLGGPFRRQVACYANINRGTLDRSPQGFADRARGIVAMYGYTALKIAPFDGLHWARVTPQDGRRLLDAGIARILAVRAAIGPDVLLLVDCHWRLSPVMALDVLAATQSAGLFWLEDALDDTTFPAEDQRRLRHAANLRGVRIAAGERLATLAGMRGLLAHGGCDVVLPDLRVTGIATGMTMLNLAAASGVEVSIHNPVGPVLDAISLQVAAALPSFLILEGQVEESPRFDEIAGGARPLMAGARPLRDAPGIGMVPALAFSATLPDVAAPVSFAGMPGAGADA